MAVTATTDGDLIVGINRGDAAVGGAPIPDALAGKPASELRWDGKRVRHLSEFRRFYIDENGTKHVAKKDSQWSAALEMPWDAEPIRDGAAWRAPSASDLVAPAIKEECGRRIRAVLKDDVTQRNMMAHSIALSRAEAKGKAKAKDKALLDLLEQGVAWVEAMLAAARDMAARADGDYERDSKWPPAPDGLADLADQF